jgi:hypothetical protein
VRENANLKNRTVRRQYDCNSWSTEYTECLAFFPVVQIGSPTPSPERECVAPPTFGSKGGDKLACGGGTQFGRRTDTLALYWRAEATLMKLHKRRTNISGEFWISTINSTSCDLKKSRIQIRKIDFLAGTWSLPGWSRNGRQVPALDFPDPQFPGPPVGWLAQSTALSPVNRFAWIFQCFKLQHWPNKFVIR